MNNIIVEICCGSYEDAIVAYEQGAKRIELNSALFLGGLTPSVSVVQSLKRETDLEIICMVRPRGAGFCYSALEQKQMLKEAECLLEAGADGLAFGALTNNKEIDYAFTKKLVDLTHEYQKTAVFHRAFDCVENPLKAIEQLIDLGVERILTSGLAPKAIDGAELIKKLNLEYGKMIEILAGSGINHENAKALVQTAQIKQIHASCKTGKRDLTTNGKQVSYAYTNADYDYEAVDGNLVRELIDSVRA